MSEPRAEGNVLDAGPGVPGPSAPQAQPSARPEPAPGPPQQDPDRSPTTSWRPWTAGLALVAGLVAAALGGLIVDLPALALGVKITSSHTPRGIVIVDTFVQDLAFVAAAVYCAHIGRQVVRSWHFGLRPPPRGWRNAILAIVVLAACYGAFTGIWGVLVNPGKEKVLNQLGSGGFSALLICVVAPMCEETLFRGYIFTALRNWRGTIVAAAITAVLFGAVHAGSAPVLDLVPLAGLGFGLCLLYRRTGSLYPCMAAHSLNNSLAFAGLAGLSVGEGVALTVAALACIALIIAALTRAGVIDSSAAAARTGA
jgi:membrane protease YdiL (CAAX protease family)